MRLLALILSCFIAAQAWAAGDCQFVKIGSFEIKQERGLLLTTGAISQQAIGIMLDTGASSSLILKSAVTRLDLESFDAPGRHIYGVGGESKAQMTTLADFTLGDAHRKDWRVLVAGEHEILGQDVSMILGDDFFHRIDVEFDVAHGLINLFDPKDCQ